MARARNIKPGFFKNEKLAEKSFYARIAFPGLWCIADREGRLEDRPKRIKAEILPYDDCNMDDVLEELNDGEHIIRYEVNGCKYIQILNFTKHQSPHHKEVASIIPAPPGFDDSGINPDMTTKQQRERIFKRDNNKCVKCGCLEDLTIDHIIPLSKGGSSEDDNLQTLCSKCNHTKGNRNSNSYISQAYTKHDSSMTQACTKQNASCPTDSFNPITDSLKLIPDDADSFKLENQQQPQMDLDFQKVISHFNNNIHLITPVEAEKLKDWLNDVQAEVIIMAIDEAVLNNKRSMKYINSILSNWHSKQLTTKEAVEAHQRDWKDNKTKAGPPGHMSNFERKMKLLEVSEDDITRAEGFT